MHRGRVLIASFLIPLTLAMSGCFALRSFKWSAKFIRPGKTVRAILTLSPTSKEVPPSGSDHVFVLIALPSGDGVNTHYKIGKRRIWDPQARFNGPRELVKDGALRDVVLNSTDCYAADDFSLVENNVWVLLRTPTPVNDKGKVLRYTTVEIAIKLAADAPSPDTGGFAFFTGGWRDDGNDIPEDSETACSGGVFPILSVMDP